MAIPWGLLLKAAGVLGALIVLAGVYEVLPGIGPGARVARVEARAHKWEDAAKAWRIGHDAQKRRADLEAERRATEAGQAREAVEAQSNACDARVAKARTSAAAIRNLVTRETRHDPSTGCPVRALLDPRELRDAIAAPR